MKLPRNTKIFRGQLDAAPFASVTFVLLIFLLLSSRLAFTPGVRIELPEITQKLPGIVNPSVVVAVDRAGEFYYDGTRVKSEADLIKELNAAVRRSEVGLTLEIQADQSGRIEHLSRLLALANEVGFRSAHLALRPARIPLETKKTP